MRRDISSAYLLTASRIVGWIIVSGLVARRLGSESFALLVLVRSTVGLLANTSIGLAPAMISQIAKVLAGRTISVDADLPISIPESREKHSLQSVYSNGLALALMLATAGVTLSFFYGGFFKFLHRIPEQFSARDMFVMATCMSLGITLRMISDAPAAVLQTTDHITLDNILMSCAELLWVILSAAALLMDFPLKYIGVALLISNAALLIARLRLAAPLAGRVQRSLVNERITKSLLTFGAFVAIAELADFLYAPTDYILINRLLTLTDGAMYAPAVQIDGAILLMVLAIAEVLLPKTALAHHAGNRQLVRRYYINGTIVTSCLLIALSIGAYFVAPAIFRVWLGKKLPATRAILPLVLIHTVVGGSSIVGRSILLGMGKVKPFTAAVIIAGVSNVILSYCFVRFFHLGLNGIIYGTIVAVVGRCALWTPWYVLRSLRRD